MNSAVSPSAIDLLGKLALFSAIGFCLLALMRFVKTGKPAGRARVFLSIIMAPLFVLGYWLLFQGRSWLADCGFFAVCHDIFVLPLSRSGVFPSTSWMQITAVAVFALVVLILARQIVGLILERRYLGRLEAAGSEVYKRASGSFADVTGKAGVKGAMLEVCRLDRPLAVALGLTHPRVLISSWLVERLDDDELEAVIAHEIAHIKRRDNLTDRVVKAAKDFFFFLPTTYFSWRGFIEEREKACDEMAATITGRPLSLASALTKVCRFEINNSLLDRVVSPVSQRLFSRDSALEERVKRLAFGLDEVKNKRSVNSLFSIAVGFLFLAMLLAPVQSWARPGQVANSCCSQAATAACAKSEICASNTCSH